MQMLILHSKMRYKLENLQDCYNFLYSLFRGKPNSKIEILVCLLLKKVSTLKYIAYFS